MLSQAGFLAVFFLTVQAAQVVQTPKLQVGGLWQIDSESTSYADGGTQSHSSESAFLAFLPDRILTLQFETGRLRTVSTMTILATVEPPNKLHYLLTPSRNKETRIKATVKENSPGSLEVKLEMSQPPAKDIVLADGRIISGRIRTVRSCVAQISRAKKTDWGGMIGHQLEHDPGVAEDKELFVILSEWLAAN